MSEQLDKIAGMQGQSDLEVSASAANGIRLNLKNVSYAQIKEILKGIVAVAVIGCLFYLIYDAFKTFHEDHKQLGETMSVMTYVISLPQDERTSLRLNMPDSLRKKLGKD